ncbi:hypothetical protein DH2020_036611 [Rehmannia glutinosa]|uniref:Uncharacterized protein n=1 Tax=Rehmannia glutinosa TaxID=99300 RepID=A0ABR0V435_REHGL
MLHCVNAWEEDDGAGAGAGDTNIVMVASKIESVEKVFEISDLPQSTMEKVTINVKAKTVERQSLSTQGLDFAAINPAYAAKKIRYVYALIIGSTAFVGVAKLDLSLTEEDDRDCTVASRQYGSGCDGSEPFSVARDLNNPSEMKMMDI